jgi:predicted LPLAT superfamily acyltransferase
VTAQPWRRRLLAHGVFWRQLLRWGVFNIPSWLEPIVIGFWSFLFLLWKGGRQGVMANLTLIKPSSMTVANVFRTYRVFWNFAWTITDNVRFKEMRTVPDWHFVGTSHFEALQASTGGAIILTAHMGSYDLGAQLFAEHANRRIVMVRAPEIDPETHEFEEEVKDRTVDERLHVGFNTKASDLAFELLDELRQGNIIAIQGDRVTPGIASMNARLFGKTVALPAGPFALAMASGVPIYPLFVVRRGRRRYRLVTLEPIHVVRRSRHREDDLQTAMSHWTDALEQIGSAYWYQWFNFYPYTAEGA